MRSRTNWIALATALAVLAWLAPAVAADNAAQELRSQTHWTISLDAAGHVAQLDSRSELAPALRESLQKAIRGWTFEPSRIDGKAMPTETSLTAWISLEPQSDDRFSIRVDDARTGGRVDAAQAPVFPRKAAQLGLQQMVVMNVRYDAHGHVIDASLAPDSQHAQPALVRSALSAVRKWTFEPERVGGDGIAGLVVVPICFSVVEPGQGHDSPGCSWAPPDSHARVSDGEAFALAPVAKLESDVIGKTL